MSDPTTSRPGLFAPTSDTDELPLRGLPANVGQEGDPFSVLLAEFSRHNSRALVLSATGRDLDEDLTVTAGHAHDDRDSSLDWMACYSVMLCGDESTTTGDREAALVTATASALLATSQIAVPFASDGLPLYETLHWRVRPQVPSTGFTSCTLTLSLEVFGYDDATASLASLGVSKLVIARDFADTEAGTMLPATSLYLPRATVEVAAPEGHLLLALSAHVSAQCASVFELQWRWA